MSSLRAPPPRLSSSRSASGSSAARRPSTSRRPTSSIRRSAAKRRHAQALARPGPGGWPGRERVGDRRCASRSAAHHPVCRPGSRSPWARSSSRQRCARRRRRPRRARRPASTPCARPSRARASSTSSRHRRAGAELERQLLELAQQPLLAVADVGISALARAAVELEAELAARARDPLGQLPGLDRLLGGDVAAGLLHGLVERRRAPWRAHSSRAKKATVVSGGRRLQAPRERLDVARPSSARRRRRSRSGDRARRSSPCSAAAAASGRRTRRPRGPPTPPAPVSDSASARSRARRSAMRPWSSPWMRYAGLKLGTPARLARARHDASRRVAASRVRRTVPSRSVRYERGAAGPERVERLAASGGRRCCGARPRSPPPAGAGAASRSGRPGSSLPWWATFSASTGGQRQRRGDVGLGVGGQEQVEAADADERDDGALVRVAAGRPAAARGGQSTSTRMRPARSTCPASGAMRAARAPPRRRARAPAASAVRPPAPPSSTSPTGGRRARRRAPPSWSAWSWVSDEQVEVADARRPAAGARIGPSGGPVSTRTACPRVLDERRVALADVEERDASGSVGGPARPLASVAAASRGGDGDERRRACARGAIRRGRCERAFARRRRSEGDRAGTA